MVRLQHIFDILSENRQAYRWLDVFREDVEELQLGSDVQLVPLGGPNYQVVVDGGVLHLRLDAATGVARFEIAQDALGAGAAGALAGAALGAVFAAARKPADAPAGAVYGMLVGGLLGVAAGAVNRPNQVATLAFDVERNRWRLYQGPHRRWAKAALRPT